VTIDADIRGGEPRVRAVRGATVVAADERELLCDAVCELLTEMMRGNSIGTGDIISVSFTVTTDLRSEFPARCARGLEGWDEIPMICAAEVDVPGSLPMCIRVLMHIYSSLSRGDIRHVYLREAQQLRPDWSAPPRQRCL